MKTRINYRHLLQSLCSAKNIFTAVCTILTALLIFKELFSFAVLRPTNTYQEEKQLDRSDLPEVVVCPDPAFDLDDLRKHGYEKTYSYYRGSADGTKFLGWNGGEGVGNLSSEKILEDVLIVDKSLSGENTTTVNGKRFVEVEGYTNNNIDFTRPILALRILAFPYGRCLSIGPPEKAIKAPVRLRIQFEDDAIQNVSSVRLFFMDRTNSLRLYPDDMEMMGPPVKLDFSSGQYSETVYKTRISRTTHVPGDPLLDCKTYTEEDSFNDCVQDDLLDLFRAELGCEPPLLSKHLRGGMCNQRFNFSEAKDKLLKEEFMHLYYHDEKTKCRVPCVKNTYTSRFVHRFPGLTQTLLFIVFEKTIKMTASKFTIDEQTLLIRFENSMILVHAHLCFVQRLGGSVSSGRTLLWILVTIFTAAQVFL